jgi:archaemetzincin
VPAPVNPTIIISPIGFLNPTSLYPVRQEISRVFGFKTIETSLIDNLDFAFDHTRKQYYSTKILEKLAECLPKEALKVIAITEVDLFIPVLTYVFGEAQLGGKACIISTYRLKESYHTIDSREIYADRMIKEIIHELGHTFNLRHCKDPKCIMHYCRSLDDVDHKADTLCRYCDVLLKDELKKNSISPSK